MDSTPDHFVIVEEKYRNFSVIAHGVSLTHTLFRCPGGTLLVRLFPCPGWPG